MGGVRKAGCDGVGEPWDGGPSVAGVPGYNGSAVR
jgi:hypothetical protein